LKDNDKRMWVQTLWNPINERHKSPLDSPEPGIKVAAYCRVSMKEEEQLRSLENQVHHYTHFIKSKPNWRFVGVYYDDGISAAMASGRRGFQRIIRHAEEGKVDLILTKNISRFSRNSKELLDIINQLKAIGVGIYFEKENIDTSREYNKFLLSTYAALAQEEIETISNSTMWGYEKRFLKGIPKFNRLYGYKVIHAGDDSQLIVLEDEAKIVRMMYEQYLQGKTFTDIARALTEAGVKTAKGKDVWIGGMIKHILSNVTYTGNKLTRELKRDLFTNKVNSGERDQVFIGNTHEPIISNDIFNLVQKKLEANTKERKPSEKREKNHMSGRLLCGRCGYSFTIIHNRASHHFKCSPKIMGVCDSELYRDADIREMMMRAMYIKYDFTDEDIVLKLLKELQVINQNDHFEFHRLKFITEIEIVKRQQAISDRYSAISIEKMEEEYRTFESKIAKIEDDRYIRIDAVEWLKKNKTLDSFIAQVTTKILRAWVSEMTVYTRDDFLVQWIDGTQTEIGSCEHHLVKDRNSKSYESGEETSRRAKFEVNHISETTEGQGELDLLSKSASSNNEDSNQPENNSTGKEELELNLNSNAEIIKIEPGQRDYIMKNLHKSLSANMMMQNASVHTASINKPRLKTAAYCRISTDSEEQKVSLKTQVAYYTYLILKDPQYEYAGIYADEGISGRSMKNRTEFLKLLEECKAGNVDLILTKSISRFSRNALDCLEQIRMLKSLPSPVYVYFEKENIHTKDEKSELMISIFGSIAQEESVNMGEAMAWGKRRYAERGIVNPSVAPYGYRTVRKGEWEVVEEEATIIRRIYRMLLSGKSIHEITKELSMEKIKGPGGNEQWHLQTIRNILRNEIYRGNYLYQKAYIKDTIEKKVVMNRGELPQYLIENHHKAIVDNETWEKVQKVLEARREKYENKKSITYPEDKMKNASLEDIFTCGECGSKIGHRRSIQSSNEIHSWICTKAAKSFLVDSCKSTSVYQKHLELHFMKTLLDIKKHRSFKDEVLTYIRTQEVDEKEEWRIKVIEKRIKDLNRELYNAVDQELNKKGQDSRKVDELTEKIVDLQEELKVFRDRKAKVEDLKAELEWFLKKLETIDDARVKRNEGIGHGEEIYFREDIFERIVRSAQLYSDGRIVYELSLGIQWFIDFKYSAFQKLLIKWKDKQRAEEKEAFLEGPEVKELLEFCKEPKSYSDLHAFMCERKEVSYSYFRKLVIRPLMKKGKLKFTIPEDVMNRHQRYTSI